MPRSADGEIKALKQVLERAVGAENVPGALVVDMTDLLGTLEKGVRAVRGLMSCRRAEEVPQRLQHVAIIIEDDLPMIFRDLLPPLKKLTRTAYSLAGGDSEEEA